MDSLAQSILVTGTSRGIGLELVRQLVKTGPKVLIATCRNPSGATDLQDIAQKNDCIKIIKLDMENDDDIDAAVKETGSLVGDAGLNLLINNAGIYLNKEDGGVLRVQTRERMQRHFNTNTTGPIIVTQKFLPLLERAASNMKTHPFSCSKAANVIIGSRVSSQCLSHSGVTSKFTCLDYKCSKTAACMAGILMARDLKNSDILVFTLHPGGVRTGIGGPDAALGTEESVESILRVLRGAEEKDIGLFLDYQGNILPF